ncbi:MULTISPECIES: DUF6760 family protein [Nostocales]|uniref:DUF6760 family protein n=1 Tax=Nostocales TaxID=1161 RepID=UPI0028C3DF22|nr:MULTISPECIES: DUF6760 family protein [Nostocales]
MSSGVGFSGGIIGYPSDLLHEEVACIAFHFHWSLADIITLEHSERQRWVNEIGKIVQPE